MDNTYDILYRMNYTDKYIASKLHRANKEGTATNQFSGNVESRWKYLQETIIQLNK